MRERVREGDYQFLEFEEKCCGGICYVAGELFVVNCGVSEGGGLFCWGLSEWW